MVIFSILNILCTNLGINGGLTLILKTLNNYVSYLSPAKLYFMFGLFKNTMNCSKLEKIMISSILDNTFMALLKTQKTKPRSAKKIDLL